MIEVTRSISEFGGISTRHYRDTILHRVNGPALEWDDGDWSWALNGLMHRYYGPSGSTYGNWCIHGKAVR